MTKVIVTGMGVCSPLGQGLAANWKNLTDHSFCSEQKEERGASFATSKRRDISGLLKAKELSELAAIEALENAGLWDGQSLQNSNPERVGCTVSASKPFLASARTIPPDVINQFVAHRFALQGESRNVIAACATGAYSIALGASWIEQDLCDVVVAGSVEPFPHPLIQAGFRRMGVMSPEGVTRPFDKKRSGFHFGEGAGVVILESQKHAARRGAHILAQLSGWALGSDSHSAVAFNSNGAKIANVITGALQRGGLSANDISHVNAHGTGTHLNDWIETQALVKAFGPHAAKLMISATWPRLKTVR